MIFSLVSCCLWMTSLGLWLEVIHTINFIASQTTFSLHKPMPQSNVEYGLNVFCKEGSKLRHLYRFAFGVQFFSFNIEFGAGVLHSEKGGLNCGHDLYILSFIHINFVLCGAHEEVRYRVVPIYQYISYIFISFYNQFKLFAVISNVYIKSLFCISMNVQCMCYANKRKLNNIKHNIFYYSSNSINKIKHSP